MQNPILTLRHLVQEASLASTPEKRAGGIVSRVKSAMHVGVCSLFLVDEDDILTLVATDGLNSASVGKIKLRCGEGLVGLIAQAQHPLNVESASKHPNFQYFPESGEERYEAFLGAPIVHTGKLVGVLVIEQQERRLFSEEEESFLVTVAAHIGALSPADFQPARGGKPQKKTSRPIRRLDGVGASPGVRIGRILMLTDESDLMSVVDAESDDPPGELRRFREALAATLDDLAESKRQLTDSVSGDLVDLFTVYEMLLRKEGIPREVESRIAEGATAAPALRAVVSEYVARFEAMDDDYFRARSEDIRVLGGRVYGRLRDSTYREVREGEQVVLVGSLVSIADIARYPAGQLAGIACSEGSILSHTALLAKALGIPAVMGIGRHPELREEELVIIDGYRGRLLVSPGPRVRKEFERFIASEQLFNDDLARLKDEPATTPDGTRVRLLANTGLLADITPGLAQGAEGIGLYRSEIPFMVQPAFPSEDDQVEVYRTVLNAYRGLPVSMRTLDVGGDKPLPYFPIQEENPALGWRGVRFTLDNSVVFMTQIRAMLRASVGLGNLRIMVPMVSSVREVLTFVELLDKAAAQLRGEGLVLDRPRVGIMAEVPVVASILRALKGTIDFVSIGSNDLSQYLLAVDRNNARVSPLFDHLHPGVLEVMEDLAQRATELGMEVSVCGDMASDPCGAVLLLGMGIESLSMPAFSIPRIKWLIRTVPRKVAREELEIARNSPSAEATRARLRDFLIEQGLGDLLVANRLRRVGTG